MGYKLSNKVPTLCKERIILIKVANKCIQETINSQLVANKISHARKTDDYIAPHQTNPYKGKKHSRPPNKI